MGWKNIRDHYRIEHHVCVTDEGICIGSGYIHNLIVISLDGVLKKGRDRAPVDKDLLRYLAEMEADPAKLKGLALAPDHFSASHRVYTYKDGRVLEKECEVLGWPNPTHDGQKQYENTHSTNRDLVIQWARADSRLKVKSCVERVDRIQADLDKAKQDLAAAEAELAECERTYPE